ncbi:MAG: TonB-dependent receptor [Xanthomonadales bacterium]|nr:TonB-dependent receptor [Xanthomonadales bacterium]
MEAIEVRARRALLPRPPRFRLARAQLEDAGSGLSLPESLLRLPGVVALARQNEVQDSPLVVRGYGARAAFGTRGVRIELDGIPASMPDGQGQLGGIYPTQLESVSLQSGPQATLAGFNAGAMLSARTRLPTATAVRISLGDGGNALLSTGGAYAGWQHGLHLNAAETRPWREHSDSQRRSLSWIAKRGEARRGEWTIKADWFEQPDAEDPGTLTATALAANPRGADPLAVSLGAGKRVSQQQLGWAWRRGDAAFATQAALWFGQREVEQLLPIAPAAQRNRPGVAGLIALQRDYGGVRFGLSGSTPVWRWGLRAELEAQRDDRLGWENFSGTTLGVQGLLKRDEAFDATMQGLTLEWGRTLAADWLLEGGLRWSRQSVDIELLTLPRSERSLEGYTGFVGLRWSPEGLGRWQLAVGRGLETPTQTELLNRPGGEAGLNTLEAPLSRQLELSWQQRFGDWRAQAQLYRIDTRDDLVVVENVGGRAVFGNAAGTRREGLELLLDWRPDPAWRFGLSGTLGRARYTRDVPDCPGGCADGSLRLRAADELPASPRQQLLATLGWQLAAWSVSAQWLHRGALVVDDRRQLRTPSLQRLDVELGWSPAGQPWRVGFRLQDLFDQGGVAGVAVNDAGGRYFDPAPGRRAFFTLSAALR